MMKNVATVARMACPTTAIGAPKYTGMASEALPSTSPSSTA